MKLLQVLFCWYCVYTTVQGQTFTVTSLPDALFMSNGGVHDIVEGSVIQLYCSVESTTATFTWMIDNNPVVIDIPHLRVRTCSDSTSTTTVLTVENFGAGDNGMYQCTVEDGGMSGSGTVVNLTAVTSTPNGTIVIRQQPVDNEGTFENPSGILGRNRSAISIDDDVDPISTPDGDKLLRCVAGHQGDDGMNYTVPTVVWIKDGQVVMTGGDITITTQAGMTNGELSSILQITNFQLSNAGVYQCIFTDSDGEIITTTPYRLDTGEVLSLERVSPEIIILRPPEKLVIEVKTSGRYNRIEWDRNGTRFSANPSSSFFVNVSAELPNYNEIFVREPTTFNDLGVYDIDVIGNDPINQVAPASVQFAVILPVDASTTSGPNVTVTEGRSINISCVSTGTPVPTITWEFNGTSTSFEQIDTVVDVRSNYEHSVPGDPTSPFIAVVEPGSLTSVLHIVNASHPEHDGVYTCIGVNSEVDVFARSSAFVTVDVQPGIQGQTLTVTSLPDGLFMSNGGVHDIVEGSVIQLYCSVESTTAIFTWMLNNNPVVIDVPHLHVRTCSDSTSTTTVLTVENFGTGDNGMYQCTAEDGGISVSGSTVSLTAVTSTPDGTLVIRQQPVDNEERVDGTSILGRNRSAILTGVTVDPDNTPDENKLLRCVAGHQGDGIMDYTPPTVVWVKDGQVGGDITITQASMTNGELSSILWISNFQLSNAGVYQCIFTDSDGEVITTTPYRLDIGEVLTLERVSPETIVLRPPEKLVIEVKTSGQYNRIEWDRNGTRFSANPSSSFFVNVSAELPNYNEIFVRDPTMFSDLGVYDIDVVVSDLINQVAPASVQFAVILPVDASTTSGSNVTVVEGESVDISCVSTGAPIPTITWEFNGTSTSFEQSDTPIDVKSNFVRSIPGDETSPFNIMVEPGSLTSVLHIVSASYPEHDGVYTCIGVNSAGGVFVSSSAFVTVEVQVIPEIEVTSDFPNNRINIGGTITLTCDVTRAVPQPATSDFRWELIGGTEINVSDRELVLTGIAEDQLGTYVCSVTTSAGTGSGNIIIEQGFPPSVIVIQPDPMVVNTTTELICNVTGDTPHTMTWTYDSGGGTPVIVFMGDYTTGGNYTLTVSSDDYGNYTCTATNVLGSDTGTVTIVQAVAPTLSPGGTVEVVVGDSLTLSVSITAFNLPITDITWTQNGTVVTSDTDNITITNSNTDAPPAMSTLILSPVNTPSEGGPYTVTVTNPAGSDMTEFTVRVTAPATIIDPVMNTSLAVNETDDISLTCTARGYPTPSIAWSRGDSARLTGSEERIAISSLDQSTDMSTGFVSVTSVLTISNSVRSDANTYTCEASNMVQGVIVEDQVIFDLAMNFAVTIYEDPLNSTVLSPENVTLSCRADGVPAPTITWIKTLDNGTDILLEISTENINIAVMEDGLNRTSTLTIDPTSALDTASYRCRAENDVYGAVESDVAYVTVFVTPNISSPGDGEEFRVNDTMSITFTCTVSGVPPPIIQFMRGGMVLDRTGNESTIGVALMDRVQLGEGSTLVANSDGTYMVSRTLTLFNSMDGDTGEFTCVVMSNITELMVAPNDSVSFQLVVQFTPMVIPVSPRMVTEPDAARFTCIAVGVPHPSITWYKVVDGGRVLVNDSNNNIEISETTVGPAINRLTIQATSPSDTSNYVCVAENIVGSDEMTTTLIVYVRSIITSVYPSINQTSYTVNETDTVTFECSATGIPPPTITWQRNGTELNMDNDRVTISNSTVMDFLRGDGETVPVVTRTLDLSNTTDGDSAVYTCRASNEAYPPNEVTDESFQLMVQVAPMILSLDPLQQIVTEPNSATFTCTATARPRPSIRWYRSDGGNRTMLDDGEDDVSITDEEMGERELTSTLTLSPTAPSDDVNYVCVAENEVDTDERMADLDVYVRPMVASVYPGVNQMNYTVNEGNTVIFECSATGIPPPTITWLRNGTEFNDRVTINDPTVVELIRDDGESVTMISRTLDLSDIMDSDSGTYICVATNVANPSVDTADFELIVQIPPTVVALAPDREVIANESGSAVLMFRIDRAAPPVRTENITWLYTRGRPNTPFVDSAIYEHITDTMNHTADSTLTFSVDLLTLIIDNIVHALVIGEETDAGRYFLVATNPAGVHFSYIDLVVFGPPIIDNEPTDQTIINDGSNAVFLCGALADPEHQVFWTFINSSGAEIPIINTVDQSDGMKYRIISDRSNFNFGELTVVNVMYADRGTYRCEAVNSIGAETANATLTVHVTPVIEQTSTPGDVNLTLPAILVCLVTGYPIPSITWQKNGVDIDSRQQARINVSDFTSALVNSSGSISRLFEMDTDISVDEILALGELGVVGVLSFEEVVREDTANYTCSAANELPETTRLVTLSDPLPLTVLEHPDPPDNIQAYDFGARWIALRWTPTFNGNRPVTVFILYIRNVNETGDHTLLTQLAAGDLMSNGGSFMFNITNTSVVLPFTQYSFVVVSCNEIGCSDQSEPSQIIMTLQEDIPNIRITVDITSVFSHNVTVSWQQSMIFLINYIMQLVDFNTNQLIIDESLSPDNQMLSLSNLQPDTDYRFSIIPVNTAGRGPPSFVDFRTLKDAVFFQIRLTGIGNCNNWVSDPINRGIMLNDVTSEIASNVEQQCQCGFTEDNITSAAFLCFSESNDAITYRAEIHETSQATVFELVSHLEGWVAMDVLIPVQGLFIRVDSSCTVTIQSLNEAECLVPQSPPSSLNLGAIVGGGVVAVIVLVLAVIVVILSVIVVWRRRASYKLKDGANRYGVAFDNVNLSPNPGVGGVYETMDATHEYETLDTYNKTNKEYDVIGNTASSGKENEVVEITSSRKVQPGGEYEFTQCPAYHTTTFTNTSAAAPTSLDDDYQ